MLPWLPGLRLTHCVDHASLELIEIYLCQTVMAHAFSPSTQEAEAGGSLSSRPAKVSSRIAGTVTQRNPVSKQTNKKPHHQQRQKKNQNYALL